MSILRRTLVLAGHYAGKTVTLRGWRFVDGRLELEGPEREVERVQRYLGRCYQAYPEGSRTLEFAQARDRQNREEKSGKRDHEARPESRDPSRLPSETQPVWEKSGERPPDEGSGAAPDPEGPAELPAERSERPSPSPPALIEAVARLEVQNDEHWTTDGKPRVDVLAAMSGMPELTRADIQRAAPNLRRVVTSS
jgi:hypothetical protein